MEERQPPRGRVRHDNVRYLGDVGAGSRGCGMEVVTVWHDGPLLAVGSTPASGGKMAATLDRFWAARRLHLRPHSTQRSGERPAKKIEICPELTPL